MVEQEPICKTTSDGTKNWFLNGKHHREDGPAVEYTNGDNHWFLHGKRHREDGPAVELAGGYKYWFLHGKELTEEEFNKKITELNVSKIHELW